MAYSMMSTTNYKRKCVSSNLEVCHTSFEDDWISLGLEDFISKSSYSSSSSYENNSFSSSPTISKKASVFRVYENCKNVSSKKRKTMELFIDQELEDTASSPIHSPKVNDFNLLYMNSKEMDCTDVCKIKVHNTQQEKDCTKMSLLLESELRKRGLCLIPTSTLLNYLNVTANVI